MSLSRASVYAIHGMYYLASRPPGRLAPLSEICRDRGLPAKHLAKIFGRLVRAGLLRATRGVNGGFALARPADQISPFEILLVVDGPFPLLWCPAHAPTGTRRPCCSLSGLVERDRANMEKLMRGTTLAQLCRRDARRSPPPT